MKEYENIIVITKDLREVTDWQLKYFEKYTTKKAAMLREKEIKSWKSRGKVENLIAGFNG